jgi:hypothetical protein
MGGGSDDQGKPEQTTRDDLPHKVHVLPSLQAHGEAEALVHIAKVCRSSTRGNRTPPLNGRLIVNLSEEFGSNGLLVGVDTQFFEEMSECPLST